MLVVPRFIIRLSWMRRVAILPFFAAGLVLAQGSGGAGNGTPRAAAASPPPANPVASAPCPPGPDADIPIGNIIEAKVTGTLDSAHLKVGKEIWVNVRFGLVYPGCTLSEGAALLGRVTAAVSQKNPNSSELSLQFDHANCTERGKTPMRLWLVGLLGPEEMKEHARDAVPVGLKGIKRDVVAAARSTNFSNDPLNPGGPPGTVHPGIVLGLRKMKLELQGGPGCSARITSSDSSVQLISGSELLLVVQSTP